MIRHNYTLSKLVEELQFLNGFRLAECFTQEKNSLVIVLCKPNEEYYLCYSGGPKLGCLYLREEFSRARKNTINVFEFLNSHDISHISIIENERIIQITFAHYIMNIILFGGAKSNIVLTDSKGIIIDSFKNKKNLINKSFQIQKSELKSIDNFQFDSTVLKALSDCDLLLGKYYAEELCMRLNINPSSKLEELKISIDELKSHALNLKNECLKTKEYYMLENAEEERILSLIPLRNFPAVFRKYNSISSAIKDRIFTTFKQTSFSSEFKRIKTILEKQKSKLQKSLEQPEDSEKIIERIEKYKLWAESLQTLKNMKERAGSSVNVTLWDGSEIIVPLNPKHTIRENIDSYFQKIKDSREDEKVRHKRIPLLQSKLNLINSALDKLDLCVNIKDIENIKSEYKNILKTTMDELQTKEEKFRCFDLSEGYILYAGKNAANNDELTMHFAKPYDIWLHARGAGGSHCVLRMKSKEEKPPKQILQKAAEITAYYSQARKGKFVPVAYTQKKYVHKPKGANPGSVVISKEQVLMVEPKLPVE